MKALAGTILPDFVVIGASKSGTAWLGECLREHPDIHMSADATEIFFFDRYFYRGVNWYAHYFRDYAGQKRVGEVTSTYLGHPSAPKRLRAVLPDATLLVSLRNPIQRSWSKYLHMWRKGDIPPQLGFWDACDRAPQIIGDGEYFRCLTRWYEQFPAEQLHLMVLDDAAADPYAYMRRVYDLLAVDPAFRAERTTVKVNEHQTPRSMWASRVAFRWARLMHRKGLHGPVEVGKRFGLKRLVLHDGRVTAKDPSPLRDEDRARLSAHYRSDVAALSELVDRDLVSLWLGPAAAVHYDRVDRV